MSERTAPIPRQISRPRVVRQGAPGGSRNLLIVAAVISVAFHVWLAYVAHDRPLGRIDPALLEMAATPVRVKRAMYDEVLPSRATQGQGEEAAATPQDSLAALSEALLAEVRPPVESGGNEFEPDVQMREIDEALPTDPVAQLAVDLPAFELPEDVLNALSATNPSDLEYQETTTLGLGPGAGGGTGGGSGAGSGSAAAREMLGRTGLITGVNPQPSRLDQAMIDDAPRLDDTLLEVPLTGPQIDFTDLALAETTQLDVPEHLDDDFDYTVTRWADPKEPTEPGYFRVDIAARRSLHKLAAMPKDVVYLIDTSSSVTQDWINEAVLGVQQALRTLNAEDRFNIVLFSDNPAFFSTGKTVPATPENIEAGVRFLTEARSRGYTDVNAALTQLLVRDPSMERVYNLILITDGLPTKGVLDTRELINLITRDNDLLASIYCVGLGRRANKELLNFLAYRNKGVTLFVDEKQQVAPTLRDLASRLRYPLIKNVQVSVAGRDVSEVYPVDLPNIHQGERFSLFGRYTSGEAFTIRITGASSGKNVDFTFTRRISEAPLAEGRMAQDWAFWKLHHLYSEIIRRGETPGLRAAIDEIRRKYKLKTLY